MKIIAIEAVDASRSGNALQPDFRPAAESTIPRGAA